MPRDNRVAKHQNVHISSAVNRQQMTVLFHVKFQFIMRNVIWFMMRTFYKTRNLKINFVRKSLLFVR